MKLTKEEQEIINYIESGKAQSIPNLKSEISRYRQLAKEHIHKKKNINIELSENDLYLLKQRASENGVSYQNIIQSLIHQYTNNQIEVKL
jgi:predicted DNA binding CopG/RHH family protein